MQSAKNTVQVIMILIISTFTIKTYLQHVICFYVLYAVGKTTFSVITR